MNIAKKHSRSIQARYQLSNALRIVTSGRRLDKLCQPQVRQHANAKRRLDQIYDVDPIEVPTELNSVQALLIHSRSSHRKMQRGRGQLACGRL